MLSGDCNICINGKMPSYSATCVECGLSRKNYKPTTNADKIRAMTDEELAEWMGKICDCDHAKCPIDEAHISCVMGCERAWLDWLKEEVVSDG